MSELIWVIERSTGITALALLTLSTAWGLLLSTGVLRGRVRTSAIAGSHEFLALLAVVFTGVHVAGALVQTHVDIGLDGVLIPFAASWEPVGTALGVVATYLLVAIYATSRMRRRIGASAWRAVHMCGFVLFWVAALHGVLTGTDAANGAFRSAVILAMLGVGSLAGLRWARSAGLAGRSRPGLSSAR